MPISPTSTRRYRGRRPAQPAWDAAGGDGRADVLERAADGIEGAREEFVVLLAREAGKNRADAIGEVREAADFCRYYAMLARRHFARPQSLPSPTGESNELALHGRGVFACISPWNFPLGDPCRPDRRGARRRQRGHRQARRADTSAGAVRSRDPGRGRRAGRRLRDAAGRR
jgi:hypothetical protein